jgi:hypothetical protein
MEAGMNPHYEFIIGQQSQLIAAAQGSKHLHRRKSGDQTAGGKLIAVFGDLLIACGIWLKKASSAPVDKHSQGIYSQN